MMISFKNSKAFYNTLIYYRREGDEAKRGGNSLPQILRDAYLSTLRKNDV